MSETIQHLEPIGPKGEQADTPLTPELQAQIDDARAQIGQFITEQAPVVGKLFGIPELRLSVGKGWATNLETAEVTLDPRFFIEQGYTPSMATYGLLHEVSAHLREVITDSELTRDVLRFCEGVESDGKYRGKAEHIFHNILSDIAGNKRVHTTLPVMTDVAHQIYEEKLFPQDDFSSIPRHLQFLYKVIRQEMIPNSQTKVLSEVDSMIDEFRDFQGLGDLIKYSTQVAKSRTEEMSGREKFTIWTEVIYPRWRALVELDRQDPSFQKKKQASDNGDGGQSQDTEPGQGEPDFSDYYADYEETKHPEPMSDDEHAAIEKDIKKIRDSGRREQYKKAKQSDPRYQRDAQLRAETGHSLSDLERYNREIARWHPQITELREHFKQFLNERVGIKRRLRSGHTEGVLDPNRLAQTAIDIQNDRDEIPAFMDYERGIAERELTGRTDYVFVFDRSGSMIGEKAAAAASSAVICLEALAGMQRDIQATEERYGIQTDIDIRTAVYTFNDIVDNPKPLSHGLDTKARLDTYSLVASAGGNNADSHVLRMIEEYPDEPGRRRILVMVADGQADDKARCIESTRHLRNRHWEVYGISIGSDDAVALYAPHSRRVDDPARIPETFARFIEETLYA